MVGDRLRRARAAWQAHTGKRIADLVRETGISRATIFLWEGPAGRPDPIDLRRLLVFYGCPEDEIAEVVYLRSFPPSEPPGGPCNVARPSRVDGVTPVSPGPAARPGWADHLPRVSFCEPIPGPAPEPTGLDEDGITTECSGPAECGA